VAGPKTIRCVRVTLHHGRTPGHDADPVVVERDASLQRAVGEMLKGGIGSVLVGEDDRVVGILTDSDVLRAGYLSERALPEIPIEREMSAPVETTHPDESVSGALERMRELEIKKLAVEEDVSVIGIVTMTDLAVNQPEMLAEAAEMDAEGLE